ncbi:TSUP family transporter [Clostridium sp. YIM B02555]|uniref:TSUP family transporter n=1 Tax=Clostridium sp. YIM B02555 TaxID=2911968 RepID=UPI001EED7472|nr:TSUP family transporter [Clostridium sp. YIM B02555]
MIGNTAGPVFTMYLLAMGFKKNDFLGTNSCFFLIINLIKVPLQILIWHNISLKTSVVAFSMIPAITLGAVLGIVTIKKLNEKFFRKLSVVMTALAGIKLFF